MSSRKSSRKVKNTDENYWRTCIEDAPLDDDSFDLKVILFEPAGSEQDRVYLNKFESFATEEKRFVIKNISKTETIFMINQLGVEKKVKDENLRVFEEGQIFLKDKKDIPSNIMALIIKHLILKMKEEYLYIQQQRLVVKEGVRRESAILIDITEARGKVSAKPPNSVEPTVTKEKKRLSTPTQAVIEPDANKKYNTYLRVRGEEWRDKIYTDDFPVDGSKLYVAITGFLDSNLPRCLINIGVPLVSIVQIRINPQNIKIPSEFFNSSKKRPSKTEIVADKTLRFWEYIQQMRINKDFMDTFKDTAFIIFSPPYWNTSNLSGDSEQIYDELCNLMYDIQDMTRQHIHYIENLDVINVPDDIYNEQLLNHYHRLIDDVPLESVTIFSVIDSILQTVNKYEEIMNNHSRSLLSRDMTFEKSHQITDKNIDPDLLVNGTFENLFTNERKKIYRLTFGDEYEVRQDPIIINYGDMARYTTFHLMNYDLENVIWSSLLNMPINKLWKNQEKPSGENEAKINFHLNTLLECFERKDVEIAELNRLIHILACRKLFNNRSSLKKDHLQSSTILNLKKKYLKRSIFIEPLQINDLFKISSSIVQSFPSITNSEYGLEITPDDDTELYRIKYLFECPDVSELVSAAEIANGKPINHIIDDFEYFEDLEGINAFQTIFDVFGKYNCVDYKYCSVTDCIILMFYNSHDNDGISREEWRNHIQTPVCLQDFFDFTLEEIYKWIQTEEKKYDDNMKMKVQSEYKNNSDSLVSHSCIGQTNIDLELLMEGSLKYNEIKQAEETTIQTTPTEETVSTKIVTSAKTNESKSTKKSKSPTTRFEKNNEKETDGTNLEPPKVEKTFTGYNLGDRRVEALGKDGSYFSKDGTRVTSSYILLIPLNIEYIMLNVAPGNANSEIWVHKDWNEFANSKAIEISKSFRIMNKDQIMINVYKHYCKKQGLEIQGSLTKTRNLDKSSLKASPLGKIETRAESSLKDLHKENIIPQDTEVQYFYSVLITWPNGLITETIHEDDSIFISHIKQYHTLPFLELDEEMRCISLNGDVIVFRNSGDIDIYQPFGSCITITKCMKKVIETTITEEVSTGNSSNKSKEKQKEKKDKASKNKSSKTPSKSTLQDESNLKEEVIEYELIIEEFETIETNGLKKKWMNNVSHDLEKLLIRTATDYCLGEIFSRRMDGTNILLNKDGVQIVTFPDATRIITCVIIEDLEIYPEWTLEEIEYFHMLNSEIGEIESFNSKLSMSEKSFSDILDASSTLKTSKDEKNADKERDDGYISVFLSYTIEHVNFTSVTINKYEKTISIISPNDTTVTVDIANHYDIKLDPVTSVKFDGKFLNMNYEACTECGSTTKCEIDMAANDLSNQSKTTQTWLQMKDSFCQKVFVDIEGNISRSLEPCSEENLNAEDLTHLIESNSENVDDRLPDSKSESSFMSHGKCRDIYLAKKMRFFVLNRDLTCSELLHRALIDQYQQACRWLPWCSIKQYDTFGDYRQLLSIHTPVNLTETEKWLMESKMANKPRQLTFKDLKPDCGKGFYEWMRPYERFKPKPMKPANVLPPRLPRAFVQRTLEQQWKESERENLKGAKELLTAILRYRETMEETCEEILDIPIRDFRSEEERRIEEEVQAIGHRIYEDLKQRLEKDVQSRAKADITTKPPPCTEGSSYEEEIEEESIDELRMLEQERESQIKELEAAEPLSESLQRYWRRRAEEAKEEEYYKYLLRENTVPPYFRNILGGATWWEVQNTAGNAVDIAERRRMTCTCADEQSSKTDKSSKTDNSHVPFM